MKSEPNDPNPPGAKRGDLGPGSINEKLDGDCLAFARLINALARASRETMQLQRYREACAQARAVLKVDDILGLRWEEGNGGPAKEEVEPAREAGREK